MKRLFEYTHYSHGVVQGREKGGRGDDKVLFTALNQPKLLQPWLTLINAHKVPLAGVYSLPLLSQHLLKFLPKANYTLLITPTPPLNSESFCSLRQTFFMNQKLQFSRVISIDTDEPQEYAQSVLTQIVKTQRYLENARLLPVSEHSEPLSVLILVDPQQYSALKQYRQPDSYGLKTHLIENSMLAQQLGLRQNAQPLFLHLLIAQYLARQWWLPKNHYANKVDRRYFTYRQLRWSMYFASLLVVSSSVVASSVILESALMKKQQVTQLTERIQARQKHLEQLQTEKPNLPQDVVIIRNVVDIGRYLKSQKLSPKAILVQLSQVLSRHPRMFIERLEWGIGDSINGLFQIPYRPKPQITTGLGLPNRPLPPADNHSLAHIDSSKHFLEGLRISGKIFPFSGDYQNALYTFNKFLQDLQQQAEFTQVEELSSPYDPKKRPVLTLDGAQKASVEAPFSIRILIKHDYDPKIS